MHLLITTCAILRTLGQYNILIIVYFRKVIRRERLINIHPNRQFGPSDCCDLPANDCTPVCIIISISAIAASKRFRFPGFGRDRKRAKMLKSNVNDVKFSNFERGYTTRVRGLRRKYIRMPLQVRVQKSAAAAAAVATATAETESMTRCSGRTGGDCVTLRAAMR